MATTATVDVFETRAMRRFRRTIVPRGTTGVHAIFVHSFSIGKALARNNVEGERNKYEYKSARTGGSIDILYEYTTHRVHRAARIYIACTVHIMYVLVYLCIRITTIIREERERKRGKKMETSTIIVESSRIRLAYREYAHSREI